MTDIEIFLCYGLTYAKMACKLRAELAGNRFCKIPYGVACHRADSIAWTPAGWTTWAAGKERAALPHRQFALASAPPARSRKSPASLARHWRLDSLAKHFEQISAKRALSEAGVDNGGGPGSKKRPAASAELRDPTGPGRRRITKGHSGGWGGGGEGGGGPKASHSIKEIPPPGPMLDCGRRK